MAEFVEMILAQGFLTCVFSKSAEIFISHPHDGSRRTAKEIFLNYGIFLFSLIGAVSIWMRMYSWMSFLNVIIGFWIAALSLIKILDRRIFYYRYFFSDEVLVSVLLILGFFITGAFVILFLGSESYLEGSRAATDLSDWVQVNFINDERTRQVWSEQVENSRAMISQAVSGVEDKYNDTMWWPPLKGLVKTYYLDAKSMLDEMLYEKSIVALNAYVSALSVVFGVYVFGFEGVIFGPLIVCGVTFAYDVSNHGIQAAQDEYGKSDDARQDSLLDGSDAEGSHSTASSLDGYEREKEKISNNQSEDEEIDQGTNIFSNAMYRVISVHWWIECVVVFQLTSPQKDPFA
ncbi:hypothetical protein AM588_10007553 [Phytophthora nicotianae]|uniref:Uncharacterized protein n=1 Tax=Phytophthora nicotianae TaxID=4792 RepID=A0A0W8DN97_PHYNI|nr:hypothetical protein AM588_10007553 [Phytophthora nicotianae]